MALPEFTTEMFTTRHCFTILQLSLEYLQIPVKSDCLQMQHYDLPFTGMNYSETCVKQPIMGATKMAPKQSCHSNWITWEISVNLSGNLRQFVCLLVSP